MQRDVVFISFVPNDILTSVKHIFISAAKHYSTKRGQRPFGTSAHTRILNSSFISNIWPYLCMEEKMNLDGSVSLTLFYISCLKVVPVK